MPRIATRTLSGNYLSNETLFAGKLVLVVAIQYTSDGGTHGDTDGDLRAQLAALKLQLAASMGTKGTIGGPRSGAASSTAPAAAEVQDPDAQVIAEAATVGHFPQILVIVI